MPKRIGSKSGMTSTERHLSGFSVSLLADEYKVAIGSPRSYDYSSDSGHVRDLALE